VNQLLLSPPVALAVLLAACGLLYKAARLLSVRAAPTQDALKPYACGEEQEDAVSTDYGQFFPFAFFFTILHVVALTVTTLPAETMGSYVMAVLYVLVAMVGLSVLYRR
jgi:NADH-quinone oxidoreductase subunit A